MRKAIFMVLVLALACDPTLSRSHPGKTIPLTKMLGKTQRMQPANDTDLPAIEDNASDCKDCTPDIPTKEEMNCSNCPGDNTECRHCNGPETLTISNVTAAFTAELKHRKLINDAQHVSFNDILIDVGNNVNELGTFQCPDSDVYFLSWSVHAYKGRLIGTLMKDGTMIKYGPVTADNTTGTLESSGTSTMSSVVQCTAGSQFWVKAQYCLHLYSSADYCNYVESEYTSISGFKIFENSYSSKAAFTAQLSFDSDSYNPILFDQSVINIGNRYNPATGRFTCPRSGFYVFSTSTHVTSGSGYTQLRRSGSHQFYLTYAYNTYQTSEDSGTSSGTVVFQCSSSSYYIEIYGASGRTYVAETTSFSGFELVDPGRSIVAFHARFSQNEVLLDGNTLKFDSVLTNEGGYYFPNVGLFVCPDDEIYFFSWSVTMASNSGDTRPTEVRLMVGGNVWKKGPKTKENYSGRYSTASTQAIVQCEDQKAVWLEAVMSTSPTTPMTFSRDYTYFTGFRIPNI